MGLFIRKSIDALQAEARETGSKTLKRVLGPVSLVALGVGVIIGAGLFSITGTVAAEYTGPAITLSFIIAAIGCCFAGLCYAEFASMIPVSGSAYTYSYATMGELIAWIIGWDLVLEYTVAATTVSISWSRYLVVFLQNIGIELPHAFTACPWDGGIVNIPAMLIVVLMSLILMRGTAGSSFFNGLIVFLKIAVILLFVVLGWKFIQSDNYVPIFRKIPASWVNSDFQVSFGVLPLYSLPFWDLMLSVPPPRKPRTPSGTCLSVFLFHCWYVPYFIYSLPMS